MVEDRLLLKTGIRAQPESRDAGRPCSLRERMTLASGPRCHYAA